MVLLGLVEEVVVVGGGGGVLGELAGQGRVGRVGQVVGDGVGVLGDADGAGEDQLVQVPRVLEGVGDGEVAAQAVAEQGEAVEAALDAPLLEGVDEEGLGLCNLAVLVLGVDLEGRAAAAAHAEEVEGVDLPALGARQGLEVAVEEAQPGAVAMQHDEVLLDGLADALDAELVERAPLAAELDHLRVPPPRAVRVAGVGGRVFLGVLGRRGGVRGPMLCVRRLGVGGGTLQVGDEGEHAVLGRHGREACPLSCISPAVHPWQRSHSVTHPLREALGRAQREPLCNAPGRLAVGPLRRQRALLRLAARVGAVVLGGHGAGALLPDLEGRRQAQADVARASKADRLVQCAAGGGAGAEEEPQHAKPGSERAWRGNGGGSLQHKHPRTFPRGAAATMATICMC